MNLPSCHKKLENRTKICETTVLIHCIAGSMKLILERKETKWASTCPKFYLKAVFRQQCKEGKSSKAQVVLLSWDKDWGTGMLKWLGFINPTTMKERATERSPEIYVDIPLAFGLNTKLCLLMVKLLKRLSNEWLLGSFKSKKSHNSHRAERHLCSDQPAWTDLVDIQNIQ